MKKFDVIIIGGGPAAFFCAWKILEKKPHANVAIFEKGNPIEKRSCPALKAGRCMHCKVCAITSGSGGAGPFSDGKALLPNLSDRKVMGNLGDLMSLKKSLKLFEEVDNILLKNGASDIITGIRGDEYIASILPYAKMAKLDVSYRPIRAMGSDGSRETFLSLEKNLIKKGVHFFFNTEVVDLIIKENKVEGVILQSEELYSENVVMAVGRSGIGWLQQMCQKYKIDNTAETFDFGIRYELPSSVTREMDEALYECKIKSIIEATGDKVRTFCHCPKGFVSVEGYGKVSAVNGQSLKSKESRNTNLAILVSTKINGLHNPVKSARLNAELINSLGKGQPVVQRVEDFRNFKPTSIEVLQRNYVRPTLAIAVPGNMALGMSSQHAYDLINFIDRVNMILPGFSDGDNLMYGPEIKPYSIVPVTTEECETSVKGLFGIGDGGGPTHGLTPAATNGLYLGEILSSRI